VWAESSVFLILTCVFERLQLTVQIHALSLWMSLSAAVQWLLYLFVSTFFTAIKSRFGEQFIFQGFSWSVIIRVSFGTEPRTGSRFLPSPCLPLYYSLTNIWARRRPSLSYWLLFLVNNKNEGFANRSPLNYIVKFLIICL